MALHRFEVENYQAISKAYCEDVGDLMVIAGPNGVGKSTLLFRIHNRINHPQRRHGRDEKTEHQVEMDEDTQSVYFSPHRVPGNNSQFNRRDLVGRSKTRFRDIMSDEEDIQGGNFPSYRNRSGADATAFMGLAKRMAEFKERRRDIALDAIDDGKSVSSSVLPDIEEPLKELIDRVVPGITFLGVNEKNAIYRLQFENRTGDVIEFEDLSSGEIDIITILFFIVEQQIENRLEVHSTEDQSGEDDIVMLIDGPESYLHPYLQLQCIEFLFEYTTNRKNIQIILATHSEVILNNTSKHNLYYLLYPDINPDNQLQSAREIDIDLLQEILGALGTSALAYGTPILLVEGDSDREILTRLYPDLRNSTTILPMEGKQNIAQLDNAINRLTPNLLKGGMQLHAVVDTDRGHTEINSPYIHELPVANIENALLVPEALFKTVSSMKNSQRLREIGITSPKDVEHRIYNIISQDDFIDNEIRLRINRELNFQVGLGASDEIKKETVLSRFETLVKTNRERIESIYDEIRERVENEAENNNVNEFNGSRIIGEFAGDLNLSQDSVRLLTAENIQKEDLHPEYLNNIVREIRRDYLE